MFSFYKICVLRICISLLWIRIHLRDGKYNVQLLSTRCTRNRSLDDVITSELCYVHLLCDTRPLRQAANPIGTIALGPKTSTRYDCHRASGILRLITVYRVDEFWKINNRTVTIIKHFRVPKKLMLINGQSSKKFSVPLSQEDLKKSKRRINFSLKREKILLTKSKSNSTID